MGAARALDPRVLDAAVALGLTGWALAEPGALSDFPRPLVLLAMTVVVAWCRTSPLPVLALEVVGVVLLTNTSSGRRDRGSDRRLLGRVLQRAASGRGRAAGRGVGLAVGVWWWGDDSEWPGPAGAGSPGVARRDSDASARAAARSVGRARRTPRARAGSGAASRAGEDRARAARCRHPLGQRDGAPDRRRATDHESRTSGARGRCSSRWRRAGARRSTNCVACSICSQTKTATRRCHRSRV